MSLCMSVVCLLVCSPNTFYKVTGINTKKKLKTVCLYECLCVFLSATISPELHVQFSPNFYARDATVARVLAMALCLSVSVCLSVCLSVTSRCSVKRNERINLVFGMEAFFRPVLH